MYRYACGIELAGWSVALLWSHLFFIPLHRQRGIVGSGWAAVSAMPGSFRDLESAVPIGAAPVKAMGFQACEGGGSCLQVRGPRTPEQPPPRWKGSGSGPASDVEQADSGGAKVLRAACTDVERDFVAKCQRLTELNQEILGLEREAAKRRKCLEGGGSCLGSPEDGKSGLQRSPEPVPSPNPDLRPAPASAGNQFASSPTRLPLMSKAAPVSNVPKQGSPEYPIGLCPVLAAQWKVSRGGAPR